MIRRSHLEALNIFSNLRVTAHVLKSTIKSQIVSMSGSAYFDEKSEFVEGLFLLLRGNSFLNKF